MPRPSRTIPTSDLALLPAPEFDLVRTLHSGQIFHAMPREEAWEVLVGDKLLVVTPQEESLLVDPADREMASHYFALDHPMAEIFATFPADDFSQAALVSCRGIRILRQPLWECLATFITSPMKQVSHIRQISLLLRERYGKPVAGSQINAYPEPHVLAALQEADLRDCRLGFRAGKLLATARLVAEGRICLDTLRQLNEEELRISLCTLPGVGRKVANCVMLFAYERLDAVPVDVWIGRILRSMRRRKASNLELERFSRRVFGPYAGYVQQYLFHHARMSRTLPRP
jgi:N-glycosylase/DNA lyase